MSKGSKSPPAPLREPEAITLSARPFGHFFDHLVEGEAFRHPLGHTVTDDDNTWFALPTTSTNPLQFNADYAKNSLRARARKLGSCHRALARHIGVGHQPARVRESGDDGQRNVPSPMRGLKQRDFEI
jgi:acyl dehydratase